MVPRSAATAAAHRFATAAIPAAVDVLRARPGQGTRPVPFYSLQSPVRAALKEVLATLHDVAHGVPTDHPASRGSGICIVGNKGTGTSTVLATAAAAVRALLPQYGRVVHLRAAKLDHQLLDHLLADRVFGDLQTPAAVFVDDADHLCADGWNCLRHLLRVSGKRFLAEGPFTHDQRICVITAGNDSTMTDLRDYECGNVHDYFARVAVQPLQTSAAYRAFHQHVRTGGAGVNCVPWPARRQALLPPCPDSQVDAAVQSWHLHTGGNFGLLHGALSTADIVAARGLFERDDLPLAKSAYGDETLEAVCLEFLRRKLLHHRRCGAFCPFEAAAITATGNELQMAAEQWHHRHRGRRSTGTANYPDLQELCNWGFLRVVSHSDLAQCAEYGFGKLFLAMTVQQRCAYVNSRVANKQGKAEAMQRLNPT